MFEALLFWMLFCEAEPFGQFTQYSCEYQKQVHNFCLDQSGKVVAKYCWEAP